MYIQITTRCNMMCDHCCFSCTKIGTDMTMKTFKSVCDLAAEKLGDWHLTLGGGEPTIHSRFFDMLGIALSYVSRDGSVHVVTNGKRTHTAIALAHLAHGSLSAALSLDTYHEDIDTRVWEAFAEKKGDISRNVRIVENDGRHTPLSASGRGENQGGILKCPCPDLFIDPSGGVWGCGCKTKSYGNVMTVVEIPETYEPGECVLGL